MNINEYFDKIYCINLSKRLDRWKDTCRRFGIVGINEPYRWEALDGDILGWISEDDKNYIGCMLSHLTAMIHAKYNNYNRILIFEDDVCPHNSIHTLFDLFLDQSKNITWDIFYFGFIPITDDKHSWNYNLINNSFVSKNIIKANRNITGAYAYGLQKNGIDFLLNTMGKDPKGHHGVDSYLCKFCLDTYKTAFAFVPQFFAHDNSFSNNVNASFDRMTRSVDARFASVKDYIF